MKIYLIDLDGTLIRKPPEKFFKIYLLIERIFPFVKLLLPRTKEWYRLKKLKGKKYILTATRNKIGSILYLKLYKFPCDGIIFVKDNREKKLFFALGRYIDYG